jgi:hypothetical protein
MANGCKSRQKHASENSHYKGIKISFGSLWCYEDISSIIYNKCWIQISNCTNVMHFYYVHILNHAKTHKVWESVCDDLKLIASFNDKSSIQRYPLALTLLKVPPVLLTLNLKTQLCFIDMQKQIDTSLPLESHSSFISRDSTFSWFLSSNSSYFTMDPPIFSQHLRAGISQAHRVSSKYTPTVIYTVSTSDLRTWPQRRIHVLINPIHYLSLQTMLSPETSIFTLKSKS